MYEETRAPRPPRLKRASCPWSSRWLALLQLRSCVRLSWIALLLLPGCHEEKEPDPDSSLPDSPAEDSSACSPTAEVANDGIDQDCDGEDLVDQDLDGWTAAADCDDQDPAVHPGAFDACNGTDDDCDGRIDENAVEIWWYPDRDGDGWGEETGSFMACRAPAGFSALDGDCDVDDPAVHPGAPERCNRVDDDCDGDLPEDELDLDRDGTRPCEGDCDDLDDSVYSGAPERCNRVDDDCDGVIPVNETDVDGDSFTICEGDCDEADAFVSSGAVERCANGIDDDCDGDIDVDCLGCDSIVPVDHATIQEAIDASTTGDLVCVAAGTWYENLDFHGAGIDLLGVHGPSATLLDGGSAGSVVVFRSAETPDSILRGFSLLHGLQEEGGGGIWIEDASPTLHHLEVSENDAGFSYDLKGGGIRIDGGAPTLSNVIVSENDGTCRAGEYWNGAGGGIAITDADVILENVTVRENEAAEGGGIYAENSTLLLLNSIIADNRSMEDGGGGISLSGGRAELTNVRIEGNVSSECCGDTWGGGIYAVSAQATLQNVVITNNNSWAGSDAWGGGLSLHRSTFALTNVVIFRNWSDDGGGGAFLDASTATFSHCDVYANSPDDWYGAEDPSGTDGNLAVDPLVLDGTFHLHTTSPLIDAGDPSILDPDGSASDMGAFGGSRAALWDLDGDGYPSWWLPGDFAPTTSPGLDCDDEDPLVFPGAGC